MSSNFDDDAERDAWLHEALRHAPDADTAPPPRVNDAILRLGRAAVAVRAAPSAPTTPSWWDRLGAAWGWLARPSVAAGFASLMVATVVGVMWWGRPLEETLAPRGATLAEAPAPPQATPPAEVRAAQDEAKAEAPRSRVVAAPAPARKAAPATAPAAAVLEQSGVADAAPRARESVERREVTATAAAAAMASAAPSGAPTQALRADAPPAMAARVPAPGTISTPGLSNLRFEIRGRPQAWTWQRDDGEPQPIDDALQAWIAQADRTAHPQWRPGASGGEAVSATLRFTRQGVVRAVLRIGPTGMQLARSGKTESAELTGAQAAALLSGLETLGR